MSERKKVEVKVSAEVNTILRDLFNQIQYELWEEYEQEIERLNNELKLYKDNHEHLNNLLQQKENIIKEVREYIKLHIRKDEEYPDYMEMLKYEYKELLEILDKGE